MDINALSLKELKDLQSQIAKAIVSYEDRKKKEALAELEDRARAMGFTLAELTGTPVTRKRGAAWYAARSPASLPSWRLKPAC